jgi:hypothetical protein
MRPHMRLPCGRGITVVFGVIYHPHIADRETKVPVDYFASPALCFGQGAVLVLGVVKGWGGPNVLACPAFCLSVIGMPK